MANLKKITAYSSLLLLMGFVVINSAQGVTGLEISDPLQFEDEEWSITTGGDFGNVVEVEVDPSGDSYYLLGDDGDLFFVAKLTTEGGLIWSTNFSAYSQHYASGMVISEEESGARLYLLMSYEVIIGGTLGALVSQSDVYLVTIDTQDGTIVDAKSLDQIDEQMRYYSEVYFYFHPNDHDRLFIAYSSSPQNYNYNTYICEYNTTLQEVVWEYSIPLLDIEVHPAGFHYDIWENAIFCGITYKNSTSPVLKSKIWKFAPFAGSAKSIIDITLEDNPYYIDAMAVDNGRIMCILQAVTGSAEGYWIYFKTYDFDLLPFEYDPVTFEDWVYQIHPTEYRIDIKKIISQDNGQKLFMIANSINHYYNTLYNLYINDPEAMIMQYRYSATDSTFGLANIHIFGELQQDFSINDFEIVYDGLIFGGRCRPDTSAGERPGYFTKFLIPNPDDLSPNYPYWNDDLLGFIQLNATPLAITGGTGVIIGGAIGTLVFRKRK